MTSYHVTGADSLDEGLLSLAQQLGESDAIAAYEERWPEAGPEMAAYHVHYVHLYATLDEAREHAEAFGGRIVVVDLDGLTVETDGLEFEHPVIRDRIAAERCSWL